MNQNPIQVLFQRLEDRRIAYAKESTERAIKTLSGLKSFWFTQEFISGFNFQAASAIIDNYGSPVIQPALKLEGIPYIGQIYFNFSDYSYIGEDSFQLEVEVYTETPKHSYCFNIYNYWDNSTREEKFIDGIATFLITHPDFWVIRNKE